MKRFLTIAGSLALVALLGVTAVNGVVHAQTPASDVSTSHRDTYLTALAAKLGISPETLQTAVDQTSDELGFGPGMFGGRLLERIQDLGQHRHDRFLEELDLSQAATFLGISEDELKTELQSGKTPLEIAHDHGKTDEEVRAFLIERATEAIDTRLNAASDNATPSGA